MAKPTNNSTYGLVSEEEHATLKSCLLEISAEHENCNLYYGTEKNFLIRVSKIADRPFTQHESNLIYAIHCRIPRKVVSDEISTKPVVAAETDSVSHKKQAIVDRVKDVKAWMK